FYLGEKLLLGGDGEVGFEDQGSMDGVVGVVKVELRHTILLLPDQVDLGRVRADEPRQSKPSIHPRLLSPARQRTRRQVRDAPPPPAGRVTTHAPPAPPRRSPGRTRAAGIPRDGARRPAEARDRARGARPKWVVISLCGRPCGTSAMRRA